MFVAIWFAILKAGGIVVATMPLLREKELEVMIDSAKISHAFCDYRLEEAMASVKSQFLKQVITFDGTETSTSKLEVLNAQVDLNTDKVSLLRQKELYANTKIFLNQILARDAKIDFKTVDEIAVDTKLVLDELTALAEKQNPQLEAQIIAKRVSELQLNQVKAARYPTLTLNTGYNYSTI